MKLGPVEMKFAELIWDNEPLSSGELVRLCQKELDWKKSTTYTVLRKLCDRGIFQNCHGTVSSLLSREDFLSAQSREFVEEAFGGSLPAFVAAFTRKQKLSKEEIHALCQIIDEEV